MKKTIIRYGLYGGTVICVLFLLSLFLADGLDFGTQEVIYVKYMNPDFMETYYASVLADLEASLPESEYQERARAMEAEKELFTNPLMNFFLMFITVFLIGLIMSILSALILKRKPSTVIT